MIMRINMRFNLENSLHRKAWDVVQQECKISKCSVNQAIINLISRYRSEIEVDVLVDKGVSTIRNELKGYTVSSINNVDEQEDNTDIIFDFLENIGL